MNSASNTTPTVTLPGTQDDWIPKAWVINAFGLLAYLSYLNRDTNLSGTTRFFEPPFEVTITRNVPETNPTPAPETADSVEDTSSTEAQEIAEVEDIVSCCWDCCQEKTSADETRANEVLKHGCRPESNPILNGGQVSGARNTGPAPPAHPVSPAGPSRPLRREPVVHFPRDGSTTRTETRSSGTSTAGQSLDEQLQALFDQRARRRSRNATSTRGQSPPLSRRGPGFGSRTSPLVPPPPPPPSTPMPPPTRRLRRSGAFYGEPDWARMADVSSCHGPDTPTQPIPAGSTLVPPSRRLRRSGAFYGEPDWAAMANVSSFGGATRTMRSLARSAASPYPGSSAGGSSTLATPSHDVDADMGTEAPTSADNAGQSAQTVQPYAPVVAIHMAPPPPSLAQAVQREPRARNLRRHREDPSDVGDVSEEEDETVDTRPSKRRRSDPSARQGSSNGRRRPDDRGRRGKRNNDGGKNL